MIDADAERIAYRIQDEAIFDIQEERRGWETERIFDTGAAAAILEEELRRLSLRESDLPRYMEALKRMFHGGLAITPEPHEDPDKVGALFLAAARRSGRRILVTWEDGVLYAVSAKGDRC